MKNGTLASQMLGQKHAVKGDCTDINNEVKIYQSVYLKEKTNTIRK